MTEDTLHSSLVGGSTAERRLACPGSYQMEQKLPKALEKQSSIYADEGTALHDCMAFILRENLVRSELEAVILGHEFAGFVITRELLEEAIYPCVDFVDELMDELKGEGDLELLVENRVEMPGIPGAFGTADVIARTSKRSIGIDWKFGVGVPVRAEYDGEPNAQLCFYNRGGIHTFKHMYARDGLVEYDWPIDMYIVQPRVYQGDRVSHVRVTAGDLEEFRRKLIAALDEAQGAKPRIEKGPHCRFAACKVICPLHTGPAIDLTKLAAKVDKRKTKGMLDGVDIDWGQMYGELLTLSEIAEGLIGEIRAQAHTFMGDGHAVPGWKLVQKRATEKYREGEDIQAAAAAQAFGLNEKDVLEPEKIRSPAQLRDALAPRMQGKTKKDKTAAAAAVIGQFTVKASSGTTIAPEDDNRLNVIPASGQLVKLSKKLAALVPQEQKEPANERA